MRLSGAVVESVRKEHSILPRERLAACAQSTAGQSFEQTHRWIASWEIFDGTTAQAGQADYTSAVVL
jgi:hypothetical protein